MKDIYKNPILYYILVPVLAALWPLVLSAVYLPATAKNTQAELKAWNDAQPIVKDILRLDPGRLESANSKTKLEFSYGSAVKQIADQSKISDVDCKVSSNPIVVTNKQKTQGANVSLDPIDIKKFAEFLSSISIRWPNLQCAQVKLTQKKGLKDVWKADIVFKYYYN